MREPRTEERAKEAAGYRDETASLVAENARLRAQLVRIRGPRRRLGAAAALVVLDVGIALALRPWFNGGSDLQFWAACAVVLLVAIAAAVFAFGALGSFAVPKR